MHIPSIKKLVEQIALSELRAAEEAILEEQTPGIDVPGEDEGGTANTCDCRNLD